MTELLVLLALAAAGAYGWASFARHALAPAKPPEAWERTGDIRLDSRRVLADYDACRITWAEGCRRFAVLDAEMDARCRAAGIR